MESQVKLTRSWGWTFTILPQEGEVWPDLKASYQQTNMRPSRLVLHFHAPDFRARFSMDSPKLLGLNVKKDGTTGEVKREVTLWDRSDGYPDYVKRYVAIARAQVERELEGFEDSLIGVDDDFGL